jgi:hypothetical protein
MNLIGGMTERNTEIGCVEEVPFHICDPENLKLNSVSEHKVGPVPRPSTIAHFHREIKSRWHSELERQARFRPPMRRYLPAIKEPSTFRAPTDCPYLAEEGGVLHGHGAVNVQTLEKYEGRENCHSSQKQ